jgi:hypothetical protein
MGFSTMFLIVVIMAFVIGNRRRRWSDWRTMERDPRMGPSHGDPRFPPGADRDFQGYVEGLETRVAQLEERLDFTERLLMDRPAGRALPERALPEREKSAPDPE